MLINNHYFFDDLDDHVTISRMIPSFHLRFIQLVGAKRFLSSMACKDLELSKKMAGEKAVAEREFKVSSLVLANLSFYESIIFDFSSRVTWSLVLEVVLLLYM